MRNFIAALAFEEQMSLRNKPNHRKTIMNDLVEKVAREAFEKWMTDRTQGFPMERSFDDYTNGVVQCCWASWKASWQALTVMQTGIVGELNKIKGDLKCALTLDNKDHFERNIRSALFRTENLLDELKPMGGQTE